MQEPQSGCSSAQILSAAGVPCCAKGLTELAGEVDITLANLSILKNNKAKAVRLSTLNAICKALDCQPGDILQYVDDEEDVENE